MIMLRHMYILDVESQHGPSNICRYKMGIRRNMCECGMHSKETDAPDGHPRRVTERCREDGMATGPQEHTAQLVCGQVVVVIFCSILCILKRI